MSVRVEPKTDVVARCVPRHDGGWLVVTRKGGSASSAKEIPIGAQIVIRDGVIQRLSQ